MPTTTIPPKLLACRLERRSTGGGMPYLRGELGLLTVVVRKLNDHFILELGAPFPDAPADAPAASGDVA